MLFAGVEGRSVSRMSPERRASCEASQEKGFRRIEENIARKPAMRRALSSLEENTLIRTQQIWLQEAERKVSPTKTSFLDALTDESISPITVLEPPPLVLPTFHITETQRRALPEGWPPELALATLLDAASAVALGALEDSSSAFFLSVPDCHAYPDPTQEAQGGRRVVEADGEAQEDAPAASEEVPVVSLVIHDSRCPERPRAESEPAAERPAELPQSPSRGRWPGSLLKTSRAAAAVASPRGASSSIISSPRGVSSPGTALLADLLDEAARQASSLTRSFNAPGKAPYHKAPYHEAPSIGNGGAGSPEAGGGGSGSDDIISGSDGVSGGSARLSEAKGAAQHALRQAEQARLELALADLSRHETQGLRGEMQLEMAELQLCVLRLHEEQRALIAAHRERQQEFSEVQACACIIS